MADITRDENTVATTTVTYALEGPDGVTITAKLTGDSVQVTSDDVQVNANAIFRVSSLPALLAVLASIEVNATPSQPSSEDSGEPDSGADDSGSGTIPQNP